MPDERDDEWSPPFARLYETAAGKPGSLEDHPWDETVFKVGGKIFFFLGRPPGKGVTVKASPDDLDGLLQLPYVERAPYIGRYGWVSVTVADDASLELALDLLDESYDQVVSKLPKSARPPKP